MISILSLNKHPMLFSIHASNAIGLAFISSLELGTEEIGKCQIVEAMSCSPLFKSITRRASSTDKPAITIDVKVLRVVSFTDAGKVYKQP